jgi:hypothetical protein
LDVVLCVFDSINHLLDYTRWQDVFARAHEHLSEGSIFVFDINTQRRLASLSAHQPMVQWFGDGQLLVMDVRDEGKGVVIWRIRVFENRGGDKYLLHSGDIREVSTRVFPRGSRAVSTRASIVKAR